MRDLDLIRAINDGSVAGELLLSRDGWKLICQVRGRNTRAIDEEAWQDLCARRGYLQKRGNPRGF